MNITMLKLLETGTYNDMTLRPFTAVSSNSRALSSLQEATRGGQNIAPTQLAGVAGGIIRPSTEPIGQANIVNGWGEKRFLFFMEIKDTDLVGNETIQYLTGYSDYLAGTKTGNIDPNMRFYINNSIHMKSLTHMTPVGRVNSLTVSEASHVLTGQYQPGLQKIDQTAVCLQRPQDVFANLQSSEWRGFSNEVFDPRPIYSSERVKLSRRTNAVVPHYLSKILSAGAQAYSMSDPNAERSEIFTTAEGAVAERTYSHDNTLFELHRKTSFCEGQSFTFHELEQLCPHLHHVTEMIFQGQTVRTDANLPTMPTHERGETSGWNGNNHETIWATILANTVPAAMMHAMLLRVGFIVHNHTVDGQLEVTILHAQQFAKEVDPIPFVENFKFRLVNEIIRDLMFGMPVSMSIEGHFHILNESRLTISIGGQPAIPFAIPTFSDGLFAPVVTLGQQRLTDLANDLEWYFDNIQTNTHHEARRTVPLQTPDLHKGTDHASFESL